MNHRSLRVFAGVAGIVLAALAVCAPAEPAFAYHEPNAMPNFDTSTCDPCHSVAGIPGTGCWACHGTHGGDHYFESTGACVDCHASPDSAAYAPGYVKNEWYGPHGGYLATTDKCGVCHTVHAAAAGGTTLLPEPTVTATCFSCHDGTGGFGVYGTIKARTGVDPEDRTAGQGAAHRVRGQVTSVVPGGDAGTGGSAAVNFEGLGDVLACNDCHSPHGANTVAPFLGDRRRVRGSVPAPLTSRLLRRRPTSGTADVTVYGSDWCLACHKGRDSGGMTVHNHPVDTNADGRNYSSVAVLVSDDPTALTVLRPLGGVPYVANNAHWAAQAENSGNRGYLMPFPRTAEQTGHAPICQQCHEDTRTVGELVSGGTQGDAATASIAMADEMNWVLTWNGKVWVGSWVPSPADNPAFQNFPHETAGYRMLVDASATNTTDAFCTHCHPTGQLQ